MVSQESVINLWKVLATVRALSLLSYRRFQQYYDKILPSHDVLPSLLDSSGESMMISGWDLVSPLAILISEVSMAGVST